MLPADANNTGRLLVSHPLGRRVIEHLRIAMFRLACERVFSFTRPSLCPPIKVSERVRGSGAPDGYLADSPDYLWLVRDRSRRPS